jgi:hypothetical protein
LSHSVIVIQALIVLSTIFETLLKVMVSDLNCLLRDKAGGLACLPCLHSFWLISRVFVSLHSSGLVKYTVSRPFKVQFSVTV